MNMTGEEKLEALKSWLVENNIEHWLNVCVTSAGKTVIPLYIRKYVIAVHVGDDNEWYRAVRDFSHPVFIRDDDSLDFVIEKIQNIIIERMKREHERMSKKKLPHHPKHTAKRKLYLSMVPAERVCVEPRPKPVKKPSTKKRVQKTKDKQT